MKTAIVHDWLTGMRGGEKCLEVICELFPDAPIYTLLHNKGAMSSLIESKTIITSFIQHLPFKEQKYRSYLPLFPLAIEQFDFSEFDLVISTSHAVAKGAKVRNTATHICYCHTPMRYVWEMYEEYFGKGKAGFFTRIAMNTLAPLLRRWDVRTADRVHYFIANSANVQRRIKTHYKRDAEIIFPPVDTNLFELSEKDEDFFLIVSALVPYKKVDLAISVFNVNRKKLFIIGKGPEEQKLHALANSNITFLGWRNNEELKQYYSICSALIFPGEEDFGIVPLEAMACGKPVIAFGKGGALETVVDGKTGIFFHEQTEQALQNAIQSFESTEFFSRSIREHALQFSRPIYKQKMMEFIQSKFPKPLNL